MELKEWFKSEVVEQVRETLKAHTQGGARITKPNLVRELGLVAAGQEENKDAEQAITLMLRSGLLPGFATSPGITGGIHLEGMDAPPREKGLNTNGLDSAFVEKLNECLRTLCVPKAPRGVSRDSVAKAMGDPGSKTEAKISAAMKANLCPGFYSARGPFGGIFAGVKPVKDAPAATTTETPAATTTTTEVAPTEAAPVVEALAEVAADTAPAASEETVTVTTETVTASAPTADETTTPAPEDTSSSKKNSKKRNK